MEGNSVVGAILNSALATLVTLSIVTLSFSAYHTLLIRDAAIASVSKAGRIQTPEQNKYLLRLLDSSLPDLARYEIETFDTGQYVGVNIVSRLPGFGLMAPPISSVQVIAPKERVS